jgi:hypothetical protein
MLARDRGGALVVSADVLPIDPGASIDRVVDRTLAAGEVLRAASDQRVVTAIARAAAVLADPRTRVGGEVRAMIPVRSGLSDANVERAVSTTLEGLREDRIHAAIARAHAAFGGARMVPARLAGFVLAGNVFTAAIRPLAWALALRVPVIVKPSSGDEGLAELFAIALAEADAELGEAIALFRFARAESAMLAALSGRCDVLHAWGGDHSIAAIRAALPASTAFVAHGHGLGAVFVPASALATHDDAERIGRAIALDVALYDQRGCLSPHVVLVEPGGAIGAVDFARVLSERSLAEIAQTIPRGALPLAIGAAQVQWRGVGALHGELFEGSTWAVSHEGKHPLRVSPGWRNVAVYDCDASALGERLAPWGAHLKALGIAAPGERRAALASSLPAPLAPRVSDVGEMQTPDLLASADGEPPWTGLVRALDVD